MSLIREFTLFVVVLLVTALVLLFIARMLFGEPWLNEPLNNKDLLMIVATMAAIQVIPRVRR